MIDSQKIPALYMTPNVCRGQDCFNLWYGDGPSEGVFHC
jgi:hypothetical protein